MMHLGDLTRDCEKKVRVGKVGGVEAIKAVMNKHHQTQHLCQRTLDILRS
jgi:hypothetical protein